MKKSILFFIVSIFLFLSSFTFTSTASVISNCSEKNITYVTVDPVEIWREYVLADGQWYLIIYYDDGSIKVTPVSKPGDD
jgi:hypothetical protein